MNPPLQGRNRTKRCCPLGWPAVAMWCPDGVPLAPRWCPDGVPRRLAASCGAPWRGDVPRYDICYFM
eukprot:2038651-Pyramimonas_sp.AAC.1